MPQLELRSLVVKLETIQAANLKLLQEGLIEAGEALKALSQDICPVDTGAMRNSVTVRPEFNDPQKPTVAVSYNVHYSLYQHEATWLSHPGDKEAKFLERPLRENRDILTEIILSKVQNQ